MSLELRQGLRQEQRLALLPQMLQSIEVLQLATTDLVQLLERELQENETLELRAAAAAVPEARERRERDDSDWEQWRRGAVTGDLPLVQRAA
jgi:RNA polymerase sigma-54 factor